MTLTSPSPSSPRFDFLPLSSITVRRDDRQRREVKLDDGFLASIRARGVLNPVIVSWSVEDDRTYLVAGERRFRASEALGLERIPVRFVSELSPVELQIIELEENIKRLDLPWQDIVRSVGRIHALFSNLAVGASPPTIWLLSQTADAIGLTQPTISLYLTVFRELNDERVLSSGTVREAYNLLLKRKARQEGDALEDLLHATRTGPPALVQIENVGEELRDFLGEGAVAEAEGAHPPPPPWPTTLPLPGFSLSSIEQGDFLEWVKTYDGKRFSLIHCDFPYGVGLFSSNGIRSGEGRSQMGRDEGEAYDDDLATFQTLTETLATELPRLLAVSGHLMFWLDSRSESIEWTKSTFARLAPQVTWTRFPLIWLKSDNAGIAAIPDREPRHIYETCLLGSVGNRPIVRLKSDAYSCPTDKALHPSAKPEAMLRHFFEMLVDESTSLFDPTCGSGSALRAAEALGAKRVFGLERDPRMAELALRELNLSRAKRAAAEAIGL